MNRLTATLAANADKIRLLPLFILLLLNLSFAQPREGGMGALKTQLACFCGQLLSVLPVLVILVLVLAGVIYAAGQILGSETRARANVWATACLTGALFGILIVVIAPPFMNAIYEGVTLDVCSTDFCEY